MEGIDIKIKKIGIRELNFEDENNFSKSLKTIRYEYRQKGIKLIIPLLIILSAFVVYLISSYQNLIDPIGFSALVRLLSPDNFVSHHYPKSIPLIVFWIPFSFGVFCIVTIAKLIFQKFTPSLRSFFKQELNNLNLKFHRKLRSIVIFLILNTISIIILLLIDLKLIKLYNDFLSKIFVGLIITYLSVSIILPVIWSLSLDNFLVKIKGKYAILFNLHYKIWKAKILETSQLGIYMKSKRIANKMNNTKRELYDNICENRWLPRKAKSFIFRIYPYIHFHEYSNPINFQKQFLNLVLALQEWDVKTKRLVN